MRRVLKFIRKRWWVALLILVVVLFIFFRARSGSQSNSSELTYRVKRQTLQETLTFSGAVDATEKATLKFQSAGRLTWIGPSEGDPVKKGQLIATLDQRQLKQTLQKELNTYAKERLSFDQTKDDTRDVVIGALNQDQRQRLLRTADQAQYDLNNSVLDVELQNISIELANLYSPINGVMVSEGTKLAGVNILPADAQFVIINPGTLYFSGAVDQTDVVKIHEGMEGNITFDPYPDVTTPSIIQSIAFIPKEGETGTVYEVTAKIDNVASDEAALSKYRIGMTGDIAFVIKERQNVIGVPTTYIKSEGNKKYVLRKIGDKKEKTYIETGEEIDTATVITSGLQEGDIIYD